MGEEKIAVKMERASLQTCATYYSFLSLLIVFLSTVWRKSCGIQEKEKIL